MPAVARVTWHNNFGVSLPFVSSDFITCKELNRRESLSSNQSAIINMFCYLYHVELKPVIIDSLRNIFYAVCLYSAYREFDTLPLFLYYKLLLLLWLGQ